MLINSFENQTNLAEWFEHRNHYSVVVTRHKDLKRTEYKIQKNDYVYDMLKVKGSVTALVTCAKSLADNFPPTTTTDTKSDIAKGESVGVVDSVGEAPLASDSSELPYPPSVEGSESGVNPPPVAVSSYPAASDTLLLPPNHANSDIYLQLSDHGHDWIKLEVYLAHSDPTIQITYSYAHQFSNDNAYKHINLPYSEYLLTCLLSCRNIKRLWAMAQSFDDDLQKGLHEAKASFLESLE